MEHYIPALLCCLHYRLEASPLQPFATTLYLHTRRWEWIFYPHELALTLDLYHALKQIPRRIRQYLTFKTRPGNEGNFSHDYLVRSICNQLKRIIDRPRVEPEWPQFLLSSQFPLREFPYALNRGLTSQSLDQAVITLIAFLELIMLLSCLRVPLPALQKFLETSLKLSRDIVIMLSFYHRFAHETFYYLMIRQDASRQSIENEQLEYAVRRIQPDVRHFAIFQIDL